MAYEDAFGIALLCFLFATNRLMGWNAGITYARGNDVLSYQQISAAAPSLPKNKLPALHAQRFFWHWVIGTVSWATHLPLHATYWVFLVAVMLALTSITRRILDEIGVSKVVRNVVLAAFVLDAYTFRFYLIVPGYIADLFLVLGVAIMLAGLIKVRPSIVVCGVLVGILARQSMLAVIPTSMVWVLVGNGWQSRSRRSRVGLAVVLGVLGVGVYLVVRAVAKPFDTPYLSPRYPRDSILWQIAHLGSQVHPLLDHLLRVAVPLLVVTGLILGALAARRNVRQNPQTAWYPAREFWLCLLVAASLVSQAAFLSAQYSVKGEPRLSVLGLLPMALALAYAIGSVTGFHHFGARGSSNRLMVIVLIVIGIASFHHIYTWIGEPGPGSFYAVQVVAALVAGSLVYRYLREVGAEEKSERTSTDVLP